MPDHIKDCELGDNWKDCPACREAKGPIKKIARELTERSVDTGSIIEVGWQGFVIVCKLQDAHPIQLREMRKAFFAGAAHLWASTLAVLDHCDPEPTERDMERMSKISRELSEYQKEFEAQVGRRN